MVGDFNCFTKIEEKSRGALPHTNVMQDMIDWQQQMGLMDLVFVGHQYTWCNDDPPLLV